MTAVIELAALTKRYGATVGIQGLDLRVEAGEGSASSDPMGQARRPPSAAWSGCCPRRLGRRGCWGLTRSPIMRGGGVTLPRHH
jgi:hypothetical protein